MTRLLCVNDSGESIPAGGCFQLSGVDGATARLSIRYGAVKPTDEGVFYYLNGPVPVADGDTLYAEQASEIVRALVDMAGVSFGDEVGPVAGSWELQSDGFGFRVIGEEGTDGLTPVLKQVVGGGGGVFARGTVTEVDCEEGTLCVDVQFMSFCGDVPDETYDKVDVLDPYNVMEGLTEAEVAGSAWVRIERMFNLTNCTAQWELTLIMDSDGCVLAST